jgi:hypothetical protein
VIARGECATRVSGLIDTLGDPRCPLRRRVSRHGWCCYLNTPFSRVRILSFDSAKAKLFEATPDWTPEMDELERMGRADRWRGHRFHSGDVLVEDLCQGLPDRDVRTTPRWRFTEPIAAPSSRRPRRA